MARVTVEDCVEKIPNRYELLMIAAQRAKDIEAGAPLQVERDNDKNSVVALREIAEDKVSIEDLQKSLVLNLQHYVEVAEPADEEAELISAEKELDGIENPFDSSLLLDSDFDDSMSIEDGETDDLDDDALEGGADLDDDLDLGDSLDGDAGDYEE
jgi:DNA-directed RNA polymerase subunit omega